MGIVHIAHSTNKIQTQYFQTLLIAGPRTFFASNVKLYIGRIESIKGIIEEIKRTTNY